ncbi:MAG: dihydroorotase, partial [Acidimicrobiia bacterium]|nr:dihydroorotase [Acidimicrobiia bacterium]
MATGVARVDVRVADGVVAEIGTHLAGGDAIDVAGAWVGPGFVDLHVHFREPGQEWKEDVASGSA